MAGCMCHSGGSVAGSLSNTYYTRFGGICPHETHETPYCGRFPMPHNNPTLTLTLTVNRTYV
jgi:hypothetical protein